MMISWVTIWSGAGFFALNKLGLFRVDREIEEAGASHSRTQPLCCSSSRNAAVVTGVSLKIGEVVRAVGSRHGRAKRNRVGLFALLLVSDSAPYIRAAHHLLRCRRLQARWLRLPRANVERWQAGER